MKIVPLSLLFCCMIGSSAIASGQPAKEISLMPSYNSTLTITTDDGSFKGRLLDITDSSLCLRPLGKKTGIEIPARTIETIMIKKRFFRSVAIDVMAGTLLPSLLVLPFYSNGQSGLEQALLKTIIIGGGVGILYGIAESAFFRSHIHINKDPGVFRQQSPLLTRYKLDLTRPHVKHHIE